MAESRKTRSATAEFARQVNFRIGPRVWEALAAIAREEGRSISGTARRLMEQGLLARARPIEADELTGEAIAAVAESSEAFGWLAEEPDLYDGDSGEPL